MDAKSWAKVEGKLKELYSSVRLKIGDDIITLQLRRDNMKLFITVYVNGSIDFSKREYQKQYWYENTSYLLSSVKRKEFADFIIKNYGKKKEKQCWKRMIFIMPKERFATHSFQV